MPLLQDIKVAMEVATRTCSREAKDIIDNIIEDLDHVIDNIITLRYTPNPYHDPLASSLASAVFQQSSKQQSMNMDYAATLFETYRQEITTATRMGTIKPMRCEPAMSVLDEFRDIASSPHLFAAACREAKPICPDVNLDDVDSCNTALEIIDVDKHRARLEAELALLQVDLDECDAKVWQRLSSREIDV
mmetsp:Transcript_107680/g.170010  ORF Transcript_107680/g.170010 Transcript_107680/m.170010 type:complete len:190 (-) Transcript_107680:194-763(-)